MKLATTYFKHPITKEIIKPGDMYDEAFDLAEPIRKTMKKSSSKKISDNDDDTVKNKEGEKHDAGTTIAENTPNA